MLVKKVAIIGAGYSGLAASAILSAAGYDVTVFEKNNQAGGRARSFSDQGFTFDMGPSWYWMPDVFESFYGRFGKCAKDFYDLKRLSPSFAIHYSEGDCMHVPSSVKMICELFEKTEEGAGNKLKEFLSEAGEKYRIAISDKLVFKPSLSWKEYIELAGKRNTWQLQLFSSFHKHVRRFFRHPRLIALMEFPVLFLGALPVQTPALYSLMNYAGLSLGTWYPMGGMYKTIEAMTDLAISNGVKIRCNSEVNSIDCRKGKVKGLSVKGEYHRADAIIASADYHHIEQTLLPEEFRMYSPKYWNSRKMSPSALIFFVGVNRKLKNLLHHNLFFDTDFSTHAKEIYVKSAYPTAPLFYVSCPSQTDPVVAPEGKENLFILIPIASGLNDDEETRSYYFDLVMKRLENITGNDFRNDIEVQKSYSLNEFKADYHAFKGNAYGLANTFLQTAFLKPKMQNRKLKNLFYAGQLTVPGPGVPPSIISGQIAAAEVIKYLN
ncbi:MAG: phytoene desaturase family protein [Chitinophagales bacterium]